MRDELGLKLLEAIFDPLAGRNWLGSEVLLAGRGSFDRLRLSPAREIGRLCPPSATDFCRLLLGSDGAEIVIEGETRDHFV
jgi:hypothetical protein